MIKLVAIALAVSCCIVVGATSCSYAQDGMSYRDAVKACGADWRASDERKTVAKGEGQKAWNAFRATCVTAKGYVPKRGAKAK